MVLSIRCRAAHGGVVLLLTAVLTMPPTAHADVQAQRQDLAASLRQLDALERFVAHSAAVTPIVPGDRYHFDYPRLLADLARVRTGIQSYLSPSRAQPRDLAELVGEYRSERAAQQNPPSEAQP
ncbi:RAQPRD family integrative conjugative element protein [Allopusillimonas ginsengisoli]|uniref:integrative conjugative element protein, RAQPRD family n=1 Tax=Allopusillimonas ginsengisoli TaxID=453575 RepID=UPI0039C3ACDD